MQRFIPTPSANEMTTRKAVLMALDPSDIRRLDDRAREVGREIGWELRFLVAPNPEYVGVAVDNLIVIGPSRLVGLANLDIDLALDRLEGGDLRIILDADGAPRDV